MEITTKKENGLLTVALKGRLDTQSAPELDETLNAVLPGCGALTFDLKELSYTSSAGLRVFLRAHKTMARQGEMKLVNVSEPVMEIFEITGFTDILAIETA